MKKVLFRYLPYIKEYKFEYFLVLIGILLTVSATAGTAYIMKPMMDDMFVAKESSMMYIIPLSLIGIYLVKSLGTFVQSVYMSYIGLHIVSRFRELLLEKIINLDMAYLYINRSGELISRVTNDISRVQYFVSNLLPELFREVLSVVALIGYILYLNYALAFYALIVMVAVVYPLNLLAKKLKKYSFRSQEKSADIVTRLSEIFNNAEIIKTNATEDIELKRFDEENWRFFKINMKSVYVGQIVSPFLEISGALGIATIIYVAGKEVYDGSMSVGDFMAFLTAVGLVIKPLKQLGNIYSKIQDALAASQRVFSVLDTKSQILDGNKILDEDIKEIEYKNIMLKYEGSYILNNINIDIKAPQKIALVGDSGGGKSTFITMLLRFYDTESGEVLVNGVNIKKFTQKSLKRHISMVTQRIYIFNDTLAANVAYGDENIDEARVVKALELADAFAFANSLENGIHTVLSESGANLSGGQRQRIAIARAIYKKASVLLFDEATSALDNKSEKRIQDALKNYTKDKITITIAHRLSTIEEADKILVMQKGAIVASGTHSELLEGSEVYKRLAGEL